MGYSERDNEFYRAWDDIAKDRNRFREWVDRHILGTADFAQYRASLELARV